MKNVIWLFALLLTLLGCHEDKGNYDYSESNSISIDMGNTMYSATMDETINIEPVFTFSLDSNETGLTYEWRLENQFISDKRNLSFYVDTIMKGNCYLRVLDTKTGITYLAYTIFDLTEKFNNQGWMILSEKDGESYLTYISEVSNASAPDGFVYKENFSVYQRENHVKLGGKPIGLLEHFYFGTLSSNIWVLLDGAETVDLSGLSFKKEITLKESFIDEQLPVDFTPLKMAEMRWISAVINKKDHKVYTRKKISDRSYFTGSFLDNPLQYNGEDLYVTDFIIAPSNGPGYTLMVEGKKGHQRYLVLIDKDKSNAGKVLPLTVNAKYPDGFSRLDNLGDMEVIYTGYNRDGSNGSGKNRYHSILRDTDGVYYYQDFVIAKMSGTSSVIATPGKQVKFDVGDILDETTLFNIAAYPTSTYMMIAHGSDLYIIERANIGKDNMQTFVKLYKHFDADITALDSESFQSYRLGVGLNNGKFYVLNMKDGINDESKRVIYEAEANMGKVVDIRYKIQKGNNWTSN